MKINEHNENDDNECTCCSFAWKYNPPSSEQFETCVICGKLTHVPKKLHIDMRNFYIEGVGQLCFHCYNTNNTGRF